MRKLKCIGGLANGKIIDVESYYRLGDVVRVPATVELNINSFEEELQAFREDKYSSIINMPYHHYKVEEFNFSDSTKLKFLIPVEMKVKDVLCFVLGA